MDRLSTRFVKGGFPLTAKWIRRLATDLSLPKVTLGEVMPDWEDTLQAFKNEFTGSGENWKYRERCYETFDKIVQEMIEKRGFEIARETFLEILPALERGNEALDNLNEIYQTLVASKRLSEKRRYYGLCFMYLVVVEGLFDENIRIMYIFTEAAKGVDVDYTTIEEKPLWFFDRKLDPIFFEGYNNRVRNSIAHARFRFDDSKSKMVFRDRETKRQPPYREELSLEEFGMKYFGKIDNLSRLRTFYIMLLGIRDLVFSPTPFGKTKLGS